MDSGLRGFEIARSEGRAALMPYMMAGFPDLASSEAVADAYVAGGADVVELGAPFSDPLADGPVIHAAATRSLASGTRFDDVMALCSRIARTTTVVPMIYANTALTIGAERFAEALSANGAAAVIIPDLPPESAGKLGEALLARDVPTVPLVAPNTPPERRRRLVGEARAFVYVVSDTRVTGERDELPAHLSELVEAVKADSPVPVAVGFGIGTPEQAAEVGRSADGVIIGSRLVRAVAEAPDAASAAGAVREFLTSARSAMAGAGTAA
jgi:tryptophan synthase alpha chain